MGVTTIGKAARRAGVHVETIRFYERRGLITQPPARAVGYRHYAEDTIARIRFIKSIKQLGFRLSEISTLLGYLDNDDVDCAAAEHLAENKITEIDEKILALQTMKTALLAFSDQCAAQKPDGMCIVNELYQAGPPEEALSS